MKDSKISENTKKFSDLKRDQIIQRITKFKEMRIQIFLTQNQFLLYEVFPMQYKQEKDFEKSINSVDASKNKNIKRDIEINLIEKYKSQNVLSNQLLSGKSKKEKSSKKLTFKISSNNTNAVYNATNNLKTYNSERCITGDKSYKNFKNLDLNNFIKEKTKNVMSKNNLLDNNVNNTPIILKLPINSTKNGKSPSSFKISEIQKDFLNCNTENFSDYLTTEKSTKKENKILDCLTMDNFNRSYNTNFYFSKYSQRKAWSSRRLLGQTVDRGSEQIKINNNFLSKPIKTVEYLITQDTINYYNGSKPIFYNPNTLTKNFTRKILEKKYVIKTNDSYSSVCVRSKSKRNRNTIDFS